jgi:hypothetical protein
MKKRFLSAGLVALMLGTGLLQTGCFGEFALVRKVYSFNQGIDNKFVRTIVFYALNVIPVYSVAGAVDFWILNLIEFWTGSNPMAMQDGETEQQLITMDGTTYLVTASNKGFSATPLGADESATTHLEFDATAQTWSYRDANQEVVLSKVKGIDAQNNAVYELYADGQAQEVVVDGARLEERI